MQALAMWRSGGVPSRPEWGLEPMQFTFSEPPVWNMATPGEPTYKLSLLQVNLSSMKLKDEMPITIVHPNSLNAILLHAPHHRASQQDSYQHDHRATETTITGHA